MSTNNQQPPAERAAELVDKLPSSPNLITKTGSVVLGTGLLATAISQELYVVNEESVILGGFLILATFIAKVRVFRPDHYLVTSLLKRLRVFCVVNYLCGVEHQGALP